MRLKNLQTNGQIVLRERMMKDNEDVEQFTIRMGKQMTNGDEKKSRMVQHLLSSASMIPSSAVCQFYNGIKETPNACFLYVFNSNHDVDVKMKEMYNISKIVIKGTGVGVGADFLRSSSSKGEFQNNFVELCKYLNQSINLSATIRKSRMAVYVSLHNINSYLCLSLRKQNNLITPNLFYGLMVPNMFMTMFEHEPTAWWYFFDGDYTLDGESLNECYGEKYEKLYKRMVQKGEYRKRIMVRELIGELVSCITENGFPYIVWRDYINLYNNQRELGTVQTLNLCAEICQYSNNSFDSHCTLMTLNVAAFCENYPQDWAEIRQDLDCCKIPIDCLPPLDNNNMLAHCFYTAYMSTFVLNFMLGDSKRREIGVSPTGLFDAICIKYGVEAAYNYAMEKYAGLVSEYIYLGCILASVVFNRRYNVTCVNFSRSMYARGLYQFDLRHVEPVLMQQWNSLRPYMMKGMANSMVTAQAPTATTSLITNVTESVQFPLPGVITTKNSESGRFADTPFYMTVLGVHNIHKHVSVRQQVMIYANCAPYIDQTQSVIINCKPENDETMKVLYYTYTQKLKTAIYYLSFISPTEYIRLGESLEDKQKQAKSKFGGCQGCSL
uniref:Ribonucleotide reductase 1 n=1 Tax=Phthorimaea operculella granulovirus TaxID=192584 RepID=A0A481SET5_9BBAC|nr:ribonucleotide reductase 1 [Phthorimaea operculella granulovirus]QBH66344.1 ribonucleotide reductase 1 [Phthorimaea operculella granulovirus]QBH66474.1 ribonucleotide reductase 1 [Phthorimaea operculella granulovirus]QBH66604.1 ribonucleotide reductase 1 [Phthorimaea operculella granulovirus]